MSYSDDECDSCGQPWEIMLVMGCVHEHSGVVRLCSKHRVRLLGWPRELCCTPCINDHLCAVHSVKVISDRVLKS